MASRILLIISILLGLSAHGLIAKTIGRKGSDSKTFTRKFVNGVNAVTDTPVVVPCLRLQLYKDAVDNDDTYIGFGPGFSTKYVTGEDARYMQGFGAVSLCSISSDNVPLAINKLPFPGQQSLTINLKVDAATDGAYSLNMTNEVDIPQVYEVWLMDAYKKDSLNLKLNRTYDFDLLKADTNSYGSNRFSLVIRQAPALMVHLLTFTAQKANNGAQIDWTTSNEQSTTSFTVERSIDGGTTFVEMDTLVSSNVGSYSFLDKNPPLAEDLYRLKVRDLNNAITYSAVETLNYSSPVTDNTAKNTFNVYPNPAKSTLNLTITVPSPNSDKQSIQSIGPSVNSMAPNLNTVYNVKIISNSGSVMKTATMGQQGFSFDVSNLLPGAYIVQIIKTTDNSVVGVSKFVKE